jgi:hypothetical protein
MEVGGKSLTSTDDDDVRLSIVVQVTKVALGHGTGHLGGGDRAAQAAADRDRSEWCLKTVSGLLWEKSMH